MGDGINSPVTTEDFLPVVGKNYIQPHVVSIPTAVYKDFKYSRAVLMIPKTPTTVGTSYIYPGGFPANDLASIPIPAGSLIYLDARGEWYVKTGSSGTEEFLVIDAGAAGNAQAIASLLGGSSGGTMPVANRGAWYANQKTVAVPSTAEQCSAQALPNGFSVVVTAMSTNTNRVGVGTSAANADLVTGAPMILSPGASVRLYVTNTNLIWVDAITAAEGICLAAEV